MAVLVGEENLMLVIHGKNFLTVGELHTLRGCCLRKACSFYDNCVAVATYHYAAVLLLHVRSKRGSKASPLLMLRHPMPTPKHQLPSPQTTQAYAAQAACRFVSKSPGNSLIRHFLDCSSDCGSLHTDCNYEQPASQQGQPHMLLHSA